MFLLGVAFLPLSDTARADAGFDRWVQSFWPQAKAAGISRATYDAAFRGVTPDPSVLKAAAFQPEFTKPIWEYLDGAASQSRIDNGRKKMAEWKPWLDRIEATYGVDREVVVAIWGMESSYGSILDNPKIVKSTIRSLATLAYDGGRLQKFGREQLIAALQILQSHDISPRGMTGSWAGAMGHTQFIPTTFLAYAVDADGDGHRNIWGSVPDALGSTANYLKKSGWRTGETWGYEVVLPKGFNYALADEKTARPVSEWAYKYGVRRVGGKQFPRGSDMGTLFLPAGARGPAFLMLPNFFVIKKYNNATSYAMGVGHLADRLHGGGPFVQPWPVNDKPLSKTQVEELQQRLMATGFLPRSGHVDGKVGPDTRDAIRAYQKSVGLPPDGYPTTALLARISRS
ncbi:lytic murein transglycosylase [Segnochrobactraceae bacterium EtOH-i3]